MFSDAMRDIKVNVNMKERERFLLRAHMNMYAWKFTRWLNSRRNNLINAC